ncbi:MAG: hypothetical protein ACD_10C00287G0001 [uncultured bacterium]|nr:MAG: hypothetical protein ACD_10C00287G0001 [uncultured bacterium]
MRKKSLKGRVKGHDLHFGTPREKLLNDGPTQRTAHLRRNFVRILRARRVISDGFDDGSHIANRHTFVKQALQHLLQGAERQDFRDQILDQFGHFLGEVIEQLLHLLTAKQFRSMSQNQVIQMRRHHC